MLALVGACAAPQPAPRPPGPTVAAAPVTLAARVRQEGWLTRFWEQLTPAQRRRVQARLRRGAPPLATTAAEAAPVWDGLGLPDRNALLFGRGLPASVQARLAGPETADLGPPVPGPPVPGPTLTASPGPAP